MAYGIGVMEKVIMQLEEMEEHDKWQYYWAFTIVAKGEKVKHIKTGRQANNEATLPWGLRKHTSGGEQKKVI